MDVKGSRSEASVGDRNDGNTKFAQGGSALQCHKNKTYQDIGSNSLGKVDAPTTRPCAVIGPDRVVPPPAPTEPYLKKGPPAEPWLETEPAYRRPPEYPHKLLDYQHPTRNISPRQTFQENMQRIMVPPTYNSVKLKEDHSFSGDPNITQMRNNKLDVPTEPNSKYCDVPYNVNPISNEQKAVRNPDLSVSNMNSVLPRNTHHGWPPTSANVRPSKPYPQELCQYLEYPSCAGPRPMVMQRPHRTVHEEPGPVYPEAYYHDGNIRYKPYPSVKDRYPQARYDYISNYPNSFHPLPPFPTHKYDVQKPMPPHPYPAYSQVPIKYLEGRMVDPVMNGYQRSFNPQANYNNVAYYNQMIHPSYGPVPSNCVQTNKFYPYPPDAAKSMPSNKLPYADPSNKIYTAEYENRLKTLPSSESYYVNDITRMHHMKAPGVPSGYPPAIPGMSTHPYYRKDTIKGVEYNPHFRNLDPMLNVNGSLVPRFPTHLSPSSVAVSPSDPNLSNDANMMHGTSHDDFGYASASVRSMPHEYRRYNHRFSPVVKPTLSSSKNEHTSISSKDKKEIDVRQFLQMWNEEEESVGNAKEVASKTITNGMSENTNVNHFETSSQDQLYVLGLVNVPSEELAKYEHIQKVSKLPENIKGYNNIELLHQFEEIVESSNLSNYTAKLPMSNDFYTPLKGTMPLHSISIPSRPLSPLDVEAKISQSVIHKDVGCNFEIKPCSPKMMNVEIAAPVQSVMDERIIEKVSNPLLVASRSTHSGNENRDDCNVSTCSDSISASVTSCKMISSPYSRSDTMDPSKTNYSIQDLECNSGVCLASLPRLDNDIELNFPEVNQQFINANKVETVITSTPMNISPRLEVEQCETLNSKLESDIQNVASTILTDKDFSKLSKYRKLKRKGSDTIASETSVQAQRTDSVIIKNPENLKRDKDVENCANVVNCPDEYLSPMTTFNEVQNNPINLTVSTDYRESSSVISHSIEQQLVQTERMETAVDFSTRSNENNDINACEPHSNLLKNEQYEYKNNLLVKEKRLDVKSKPSGYSESIRSILEDENNGTSKLFEEIERNRNKHLDCIDPSENPKRRKRSSSNTKSRFDKRSRTAFEGSSSQAMEGEHIKQLQVSEFGASDVEDSINVKMRELFGELSGAETEPSSNDPHDNSRTNNNDDEMLTTKIHALNENIPMIQSDQTKNNSKMENENINQSQIPKEGCNTEKILSTCMTSHDDPKLECKVMDTDLQSSTEKVINTQSSLSPSCVEEVDNESRVVLSRNNSLHTSKSLLSPWIQKLIVHTEGFCANSIEHCLLSDLNSNSFKPINDNICAKEKDEINVDELESNNYSHGENKSSTEERQTWLQTQDEKQEVDLNTVLSEDSPFVQTTCLKSLNVLAKVCLTDATEEQDLLKPVENPVPQQTESENEVIKSKDAVDVKVYKKMTSTDLTSKCDSFIGLETNYTSCSEIQCQSKLQSTNSKTENFGDGSDTDTKPFSPYDQDVSDIDNTQKEDEKSLVPSSDLRNESINKDKCGYMLVNEPAKRVTLPPEEITIPDTSLEDSMNDNKTAAGDNCSNKDKNCVSENELIRSNAEGGSEDLTDEVAAVTSYKQNTCLVSNESQTNTERVFVLSDGAGEENTFFFKNQPILANAERCSKDSMNTVVKENNCVSEKESTQTNSETGCEDFTETSIAEASSFKENTGPIPIIEQCVDCKDTDSENTFSVKKELVQTSSRRFSENSTDSAEPTQTNAEDNCEHLFQIQSVHTNTENFSEDSNVSKENNCSLDNETFETNSSKCLNGFNGTATKNITDLSKSEPFQTKTKGYFENLTDSIARSSTVKENIDFPDSEPLDRNEKFEGASDCSSVKENIDFPDSEPLDRNEKFEGASDSTAGSNLVLIENTCLSKNEQVLTDSETCFDKANHEGVANSSSNEVNTYLSKNEPFQLNIKNNCEISTIAAAAGNSSPVIEKAYFTGNEPVQSYIANDSEESAGGCSSITDNTGLSDNEPIQSYIERCSEDSTESTTRSSSIAQENASLSENESVPSYIEDSIEATTGSSTEINTSLSKNESLQSYNEGHTEDCTETTETKGTTTGNISLSENDSVPSQIKEYSEGFTETTTEGSTTGNYFLPVKEFVPSIIEGCENFTETTASGSCTTGISSRLENEPVKSYFEGRSEDSTEATAGSSKAKTRLPENELALGYCEDTADTTAGSSTAKGNTCLSENELALGYCEDTADTTAGSSTAKGNTCLSENELALGYCEDTADTTAGSSTAKGNTCLSENELALGYCEDTADTTAGSCTATGNTCLSENELVLGYPADITAEESSTSKENDSLPQNLLDQANISEDVEDTIIDPATNSSTNTDIAHNCNQIEEVVSLCLEETAHRTSSFHLKNTDMHTNEIIDPNKSLVNEKCPTTDVIIKHDTLSSDNQDDSVSSDKQTIEDSSIINGNNDESVLKPIQQEESCQGIATFNNPGCEDQAEDIPENSPYTQNYVIRKRRNLKRSLSDTALNEIREDHEPTFQSFIRPSKRRNILKREQERCLFAENICQVIQNHRRNSVSSVQNEENVSFCILIDNDCIITDELNESGKICFSEVPESCIACIQEEPLNDDVTTGEIITFQEEVNSYELTTGFDEEEKSAEPWLEDVACVETVVSDDIAENIIISPVTSPTDLDSEDDYYDEGKESFVNEHANEPSCIFYSDNMNTEYNRVDHTLYQTLQNNVDNALNTSDFCVEESYSGHYDTKYSQDILLGSTIQEEASKNSIGFECTSPMSMSSNGTANNSPNRENIELENYISNTESVSMLKNKGENFVCPLTELWNEKDETKILDSSPKTNIISFESNIRDTKSSKKSEDSKCAISSSPEVSSTTSEEKNTSILLKITNYSGSRVSQVSDICPVNSISCKYTEKRDYLSSSGKQYLNPNLSTRTLITKAAQKYIPPLKETIPHLKVKLALPPNSLLRLRKIKMAKATPKLNEDKSIAIKASREEGPKKLKPKFEDVLKSIEETQYQKHKENSKKIRKSIPKVVIKKNENGSHYASTSCKDSHGPDLTGRKWQPWVFLERNHFVDKMALKRKTRAIFSHRKNCYVLAEKFYKYKSVGTKFVISQPKSDQSSSGHLKYTIRLKHQY